MAMVLAILWVCVSNMHSHVMVWALGAKSDFGGSGLSVRFDIFPVLGLHICTWVTYSPQDSVQGLVLTTIGAFRCVLEGFWSLQENT
jgi:hypothetical protein